MFRITRLTDYGTMILADLASQPERFCSASEIAERVRVSAPTVQKLLKTLAKSGLVDSARGVGGGYRLSRSPDNISAAQILDALEGPVAITECSTADGQCELESVCHVGGAWQRINRSIRGALMGISLSDLGHPPREFPAIDIDTPADSRAARGNG